MELRRIEEICAIIEQGFETRAQDREALARFLLERHVTPVDVLEALEDAGRRGPEQAATASGLLRMAAELLAPARGEGTSTS